MGNYRNIACPRCGNEVKIPFYWMLGIEGIFRCKTCQLRFKTGYKMGAVLSALSLTASVVTAQLLVYLCSIYSFPLFSLLVIPLWIAYGFTFRKGYMLHKAKRYAHLHPYETDERTPPAPLPQDVAFDEPAEPRDDPASFSTNPPTQKNVTPSSEEDCDFEIVYTSERQARHTPSQTEQEMLKDDYRF